MLFDVFQDSYETAFWQKKSHTPNGIVVTDPGVSIGKNTNPFPKFQVESENKLPSLKLTAKAPENGWLVYGHRQNYRRKKSGKMPGFPRAIRKWEKK